MRGVSLWLGIDEVRLNHPALAVPLLREAVRQDPQNKEAETWWEQRSGMRDKWTPLCCS